MKKCAVRNVRSDSVIFTRKAQEYQSSFAHEKIPGFCSVRKGISEASIYFSVFEFL